ncbi:RagB/SusD family nutrient uptake outer membrane protein [Nonlabens ponticola]|uniref:RagB/SusD family nutrient uptake outer membrane protein n=1 Tax=Nonlabens ponticola TaxID=2496866 RepID=A0A3S9MXN8_9FLAO|nr:RagB/SusD family nutrient uptake outer membrane protein [Nonlabens ponticola]AZQ43960.1 RagB/SusD family nutrient uptake outer membrane protein [Nonlabens ponticola]
MRNRLLYISLIIMLASCSDFLDVEPDEQVSISEQLSTQEGVEEAVSGIYFSIEAQLSGFVHTYPGITGGNITFAPRISNRELEVPSDIDLTYNFESREDSFDFESYYDNGYDDINAINLILANIDSFEFLTDGQRDQLEAEMLTARALSHYQLSLLFSQNRNFTSDGSHLGIVYNTRQLEASIDFPARNTVNEVYELLQADLERALELFTGTSFLDVGPERSYFNETNTRAIYARVALQYNDWETAAFQANEVISNSNVSLTSQDQYVDQWLTDQDLNEGLLTFSAPQTSEGDVSSSVSAYYLFTNQNIYNRFVASDDLLDLFEDDDIRRELYQEQTLPTSRFGEIEFEDYNFSLKYQEDNATTFIRLSEMYLIHAEALARLNTDNGLALSRLNDIRNRAGIESLDSTDNLLEEIFLERRREVAFESQLLYDLMRYEKDIERDQGCLSNVCNLSYPSPFFILPIPEESVINNENMIQNEGY